MAPPPPPPLMEELEEEVLLRMPPDDPASLLRAALVCRRWRRLVSGPFFRRRFRELHRTPPMLGLLCNIVGGDSTCCFVPTAADFCAPDLGHHRALDARHGRVLLQCRRGGSWNALMVWDPITDEKMEVPSPFLLQSYMFSWTAAILCAACGRCNHLDCHRGPFLVVFLGSDSGKAFVCTYSSDAGTWSEPIATEQPEDIASMMPSVLLGNVLYFGFLNRKILLKYDLGSQKLSVSGIPAAYTLWWHIVLDGGLGFAAIHKSKLLIWRKDGPEEDAGWTQNRVIELEKLLTSPNDAILPPFFVVGCIDGTSVIFLRAGFAIFTVDLKTYKVKKVCEGKNIYSVMPYMNFCTPGRALLGFWLYSIFRTSNNLVTSMKFGQ
ncbi:unnamed protein product [Urochloa decumbens]|uniref:F-box domain-containing protein n=1 Tax=Urochloa decumbens TaxID=240449 RepID=A0ABC9GC24_9POAL